MHELSYCEGVLEAVERRAGTRQVAAIGVRIGAVHRVVAGAFQQSFELVSAAGPAAGATTEVIVVPVHGHCMDCRHDFDSSDSSPACPACGSLDVAVAGGDEVVLEWLRYADPADPADPSDPSDPSDPRDLAAELVPAHTHVRGV